MRPSDEQWFIETLRTAITRGYKLRLLAGWRVRIYNNDGETRFTFHLDDFTEKIQADAVDLIYPYID